MSLTCSFFLLGPWLRPGQARAKPWLRALARPMISESPGRLQPGQSRGFRAKPGRNNTIQEAEVQKEHAEAEKKKPKMNGFKEASTVGDFLAPCPSQYAVQKLTNFEYIELWYFSPDGCKEALKTSKSVADDYGLTKVDDQLTIRPASAFKASKAALADHELPFSVFLRAKNMFLVQISQAKWPQTHVDTLSLFFWCLENHAIRNHSDIGDMVILNYASRVRHDWHDCLKRDEGFNIGNLNETLLRTISEELWDKVRSRTLALPVPYVWAALHTTFITAIPATSGMDPMPIAVEHRMAESSTLKDSCWIIDSSFLFLIPRIPTIHSLSLNAEVLRMLQSLSLNAERVSFSF
ncbi:uncharacterized protein EDB91DRAFT_1253287 [Suillus paluster]|uniref:uncharacterized protein n=1 Tax=Suillus paluster TaxID=48578 RepID=UPI001B881C34|nr:uncharacterized protein EDB91DRAFT_1253287 [Suillus paluster]KAG1728859.1 hypothetical protein EDB91DRAFT_1253287 [Suillus paluster]